MFKNLGAGMIGIRDLSLPETVKLAKQTGYAGIDFNIREAAALVDQQGLSYVRDLFESNNILPGQWSLPVVGIMKRHGRQSLQNCRVLPKSA